VTQLTPVRALLFDLDGTLVDTETQTDRAIDAVLVRYGITGFALPASETRGRTWAHVAGRIRALTSIEKSEAELSAELLEHWNRDTAEAKAIPGAPEALRAAAAAGLRLAVVSSSPRAVIDRFLEALGVAQLVGPRARIGADQVRHGKPDPEGFLGAAQVLGVIPGAALVFEDSRAGLLAARAAGMRSVFITCCAADIPELAPLATAVITDYRDLPASFWAQIVSGTGDLGGKSSG
jgi:HAD superfamily hydrolase (TIGR01509 family)